MERGSFLFFVTESDREKEPPEEALRERHREEADAIGAGFWWSKKGEAKLGGEIEMSSIGF